VLTGKGPLWNMTNIMFKWSVNKPLTKLWTGKKEHENDTSLFMKGN